MRLLNVETLAFQKFDDEAQRPKYVIASHRWSEVPEATFRDVQERRNVNSGGYKKVKAFAKYVQEKVAHVKWLWIDTCCINKDSDAETSEAINRMFKWYRGAALCVAYLGDVKTPEDRHGFRKSEWHQRGWTLQELLAPPTVVFVTKDWKVIGNKGAECNGYSGSPTGPGLEADLAEITGVPVEVLHMYELSRDLPVLTRMAWIDGRKTTKPEDMSYALYGLFGVSPGANYGEEAHGARTRLEAAIRQQEEKKPFAPPNDVQIELPNRMFHTLTERPHHLKKDKTASYWHHLTHDSYKIYERIAHDCKVRSRHPNGKVHFRVFLQMFDVAEVRRERVLSVWARLVRDQNEVASARQPVALVMATLYMLHVEKFLHETPTDLSDVDGERRRTLKKFDQWIRCKCSRNCGKEWCFVNDIGLFRGSKNQCDVEKYLQGKTLRNMLFASKDGEMVRNMRETWAKPRNADFG